MNQLASINRSVRKLFYFVVASSILIFGLATFSKLSVDYVSFAPFYGGSVICLGGAVYMRMRGDRFLAPMFEVIACGMALVLPILVSTYLAIGLNLGLADAYLISMDNALGFDWYAAVSWVDQRPLLAEVLLQSYASFEKQLLAVPVLLCLFGKADRAAAFIAGYGVLCFLSSIISIWFPALGTYAVYGYDQSHFQNLNIHFGYHFLESFHAIRDMDTYHLSLGTASGILTFPSVHAGIAFLIMWAMWENRILRVPFLILNALMALSAVTHANHYLIDIVGGLGVAAVTVVIVEWVFLGTRPRLFVTTLPQTSASS